MAADEAGARRAGERLEKMTPDRRQGALTGTAQEVIDRIGEYMEAGAEGLNIAFRAPIDWEAFEAYIENVLPVFHRPA
jgi:alkanesulfonate monooxygenase SsuD/methylene tetrahydromethanopterin reductase-like flavin-dependent oxidoreductase (luciferase family)